MEALFPKSYTGYVLVLSEARCLVSDARIRTLIATMDKHWAFDVSLRMS